MGKTQSSCDDSLSNGKRKINGVEPSLIEEFSTKGASKTQHDIEKELFEKKLKNTRDQIKDYVEEDLKSDEKYEDIAKDNIHDYKSLLKKNYQKIPLADETFDVDIEVFKRVIQQAKPTSMDVKFIDNNQHSITMNLNKNSLEYKLIWNFKPKQNFYENEMAFHRDKCNLVRFTFLRILDDAQAIGFEVSSQLSNAGYFSSEGKLLSRRK